jgi:hypothetical protein
VWCRLIIFIGNYANEDTIYQDMKLGNYTAVIDVSVLTSKANALACSFEEWHARGILMCIMNVLQT